MRHRAPTHNRPEVLFDVVFEDGLLYVAIANTGGRPAFDVTCEFARPFRGLGGSRDMTHLPLFRRLRVLAPGREIRTLLDSSAAYFAREEPTELAATVRWRDADGEAYEARFEHDLAVFREIAFVVR